MCPGAMPEWHIPDPTQGETDGSRDETGTVRDGTDAVPQLTDADLVV